MGPGRRRDARGSLKRFTGPGSLRPGRVDGENPVTMILAAIASLLLQTPTTSKPDLAKEFTALQNSFEDAYEAYYAPLRAAKTDEERARIQLDPKTAPVPVFLERFQAFAARAKGDDAGARALLWLFSNTADVEPKVAKSAVDDLVGGYLASPRMADLAQTLQYNAEVLGRDRSLEVLSKIEKGSTLPHAKAAALFVSGALLLDEGGHADEAKARFQRVRKEFPETPWAARAEGSLFETENLQVGMTAPAFDAIDENGKAWSSSELHGKVVILDFWGFW